eukprot:1362751-Rhodomonas_salina.2
MVHFLERRKKACLRERLIEQQHSVFGLHNQFYPVSFYDSMTTNLQRANDIILASGGYVEEAAVYAECIGLSPYLPWKKYGLNCFPSYSDSYTELDSSLRTEMEKQIHTSVLKSRSTARAHAETWGDEVWEEMKLSSGFTQDRRLHLMDELARLHCHLRFRIVLRPLIAPPSLSATGNFLLLLSCLSIPDQTLPSTFRNRNHDVRLDHLHAFFSYGHEDLPLLRQQLDQGAKASQDWNRDFVFRSMTVGTGLRIRRKHSKLRLATASLPTSTGQTHRQQVPDTVAVSTCPPATPQPELPSVSWPEIAEHLALDQRVNWRQCRMLIGNVEATTCLYHDIPHRIPPLSSDSISISLPSLGKELLPLLLLPLAGGSGTAA